ncbi:MAG: ABC transporter permease [Acidobacteria bacterium]|nr:ABC transporter permease [Acidobacteriota bacterium]
MRMIREAIAQGAAALVNNPLRAGLGALAIAVAVATIVLVVSALDGVALYARQTTARTFGSDTFLIAQIASPGRVSRRELQEQLQRNPPIRRTELKFLDQYAGGLVEYAPNAQTRADVMAGGRKIENASVTGTTWRLANLRDLAIDRGRFFRADEDQRGEPVVVIGADIVDALFPAVDPLGQPVRIAGRRFIVIGTQERQGQSGGTSLDKYAWMPLRAFERAFGTPRSLQIFAKATGDRPSVVGEDRARISLRARRALAPGVPDTFDILTPDAARGFVASLSERIGAAAGPISLMALIAAIVVVTNTVLVSVTQRTREIGVRRALGASRRQIMREVLAESAQVSLVGGAVGTAVAVTIVSLLARTLDLPVSVRGTTVAWSLTASALSGLAAGWYPARRAVRLDVIAAMRAE